MTYRAMDRRPERTPRSGRTSGRTLRSRARRTERLAPPGRSLLRRAGMLATLAAVLLLGIPDRSAPEDTGDMSVGIAEAQAQGKRRRRGRARPAARKPARQKPAGQTPANQKPAGQAPASTGPARQQPAPDKSDKVFDFTGLDISGQLRAPQLMYFLDRATEELEQASLERRSFVPEMARSLDEEAL